MKKLLMVLALVLGMTVGAVADSYGDIVVSIGNDLNQEQRAQMLRAFGVDESVEIVVVTNAEERKYLGNYVSDSLLGTRAISSSYVEKLPKGSGIEVEVSNVTWVDEQMIANALATAGVTDARVKVSSPFQVSGTAALTGILKAFEGAAGVDIGEAEKQIANEEIAKTGELGQEIGMDKAAELIEDVKLKVVESDISDPEEIRIIIEDKARELNVTLNEEQFNKIISLMQNINSLNIDLDGIKNQIANISDRVSSAINSEEAKGIFAKIGEFFRNLFSRFS